MNQKVVKIKSDLKDLYKKYLTILKPLNKLRPKEIELMALLLYYNELEKPNFKHDADRWRKVFDYDTKVKIRDELGVEDYSIQNLLSSLRKKNAVIKEDGVNTISRYYIPDISIKDNKFHLIFTFEVDGRETA